MLCSEQRQGGAARFWARCCGARMGEAGSQGAFKGAPGISGRSCGRGSPAVSPVISGACRCGEERAARWGQAVSGRRRGRGRAGRGRGPDERGPVAGGWWARWLGRADWAGAAERARGDAGAGRVARWRAGERAGRESQLGHGERSGVASWAGRVGLDLASLG